MTLNYILTVTTVEISNVKDGHRKVVQQNLSDGELIKAKEQLKKRKVSHTPKIFQSLFTNQDIFQCIQIKQKPNSKLWPLVLNSTV